MPKNDIGMIECGLANGIAMSNSVEIIKNAATHITKDDNNNDGMYRSTKRNYLSIILSIDK